MSTSLSLGARAPVMLVQALIFLFAHIYTIVAVVPSSTATIPAVPCGSSLMFEFANGLTLISLRMPYDGDITLYLYAVPAVQFISVEAYDATDLTIPIGGAARGVTNHLKLAGVTENTLVLIQIDGTGFGSAYALAQCTQAAIIPTSTTPAPTEWLGNNIGCSEGKSGVFTGSTIEMEATINEYSGGRMAIYVNGVQVTEIRAFHKGAGMIPMGATVQPGIQYLVLENLAIGTSVIFEIDAVGEGTTYYALIVCTPPSPKPTVAPTTGMPTPEPTVFEQP